MSHNPVYGVRPTFYRGAQSNSVKILCESQNIADVARILQEEPERNIWMKILCVTVHPYDSHEEKNLSPRRDPIGNFVWLPVTESLTTKIVSLKEVFPTMWEAETASGTLYRIVF